MKPKDNTVDTNIQTNNFNQITTSEREPDSAQSKQPDQRQQRQWRPIKHGYSNRIIELEKSRDATDINVNVWNAQYKAAIHRFKSLQSTGIASYSIDQINDKTSSVSNSVNKINNKRKEGNESNQTITELQSQVEQLKGVIASYKEIIASYQQNYEDFSVRSKKKFTQSPAVRYKSPPKPEDFDDVVF